MSEAEYPWSQYEKAYKRIHDAVLSQLTSAPFGKHVTKVSFEWNNDGSVKTAKAYEGDALLFTLTFAWNVDGTLSEVSRS
ncbi:MAG TPA: hypothetical protein VIH48_00310 [Candidatus Bathyarchaeia archaeon]